MGTLTYLQTGGGLLIVLGLIALAAFLARKAGLGGNNIRREDRRLSIVEAMTLDPKRRVLLIKCDYTEHLVLLGPNSETVLSGRPPERGVYQSSTTNAPVAANAPAHPQANPADAKAEAAARAAAFAASGAGTLNKPPGERPGTWTSRKPSSDQGRREPIIGPVPREPK
ncbi:MAG: flagellar biosynthetic protein FliO [Alphaproteobacteria bacterium]